MCMLSPSGTAEVVVWLCAEVKHSFDSPSGVAEVIVLLCAEVEHSFEVPPA